MDYCEPSSTSVSDTTIRNGVTLQLGVLHPDNISGKFSLLTNQNLKSLPGLTQSWSDSWPKNPSTNSSALELLACLKSPGHYLVLLPELLLC